MSESKSIKGLLWAITAGAYALSAGQPSAQAKVPDPTVGDYDVWSTIKRISESNPASMLRIQLASEAGKSELVSAIVQSIATCTDDVDTCVRQAIGRLGGLSNANLLSLATLSSALEAVGIQPILVSQAMDVYSTMVAEAIVAGVLPEQFAVVTLSEAASASLYL